MPGDSELERLYDAHASALYAFLLNLTRDEADTRDLLQEVFVKIARDESWLRGVREERAFLIRLAHNAAIDLMRRRGTRERVKVNLVEIVSPFAPASDPDEEMFRNELAAALAELPEEQRAVAHLKLWGGLTFEAIAAALEIPPNTAASRYRYALDKMRERLRPLYEELKRAGERQ
ncbi:MAG: RNA polymerase sigma factor [Verrucomicrobiae bacterium]|nr:RNA polymerase sigma factor [Verrucomicrobiae bacterium]